LRHLIRRKQMVKCSKAEVRRLKTALRWKIPAAQRERVQMVLLRESGMTQPSIAAAMGVSLSTVNRAHMAYDQGGIKALKPKVPIFIGGGAPLRQRVQQHPQLMVGAQKFARRPSQPGQLLV
jgi:Winged helix-turn helix